MKYYAVIDTNVLVSALLKLHSVPGTIAIEALIGDIIPVLNEEILAEYEDVLSRPKFRFNADKVRTRGPIMQTKHQFMRNCRIPRI